MSAVLRAAGPAQGRGQGLRVTRCSLLGWGCCIIAAGCEDAPTCLTGDLPGPILQPVARSRAAGPRQAFTPRCPLGGHLDIPAVRPCPLPDQGCPHRDHRARLGTPWAACTFAVLPSLGHQTPPHNLGALSGSSVGNTWAAWDRVRGPPGVSPGLGFRVALGAGPGLGSGPGEQVHQAAQRLTSSPAWVVGSSHPHPKALSQHHSGACYPDPGPVPICDRAGPSLGMGLGPGWVPVCIRVRGISEWTAEMARE